MEIKFWQQRWKNNQIGFHQPDVNPYLMECFAQFKLQKNSRIFVPLCGKTLDIGWLLNQGMRVCAVELSEKAIIELFMSLNIQPTIIQTEKFTHYKAENIDIFVGNFCDLNIEILSKVDLIYDRAALVALPSEMRHQYVSHIIHLSQKSPQLLINYHYNQTLFDGPPFSVEDAEIEQLYDCYTNIECIKTVSLTKDVLNQRISEPHTIHEKVWFIQ